MMKSPSLHAVLLGLSLSCAAAGCADLLPDSESLAGTSSDLQVSSWSSLGELDHEAWLGAQVATINGTTILVRSGTCLSPPCDGGIGNFLYWSKLTPTGWTTAQEIPSQSSSRKVSLAAFDGGLYMVHTGDAPGSTETWISRFDPTTETWSTNYLIPYPSLAGPPAITAFRDRLWFVGATPGTFQMWTATMSAGEIFSVSAPIARHFSASRPSAAVYGDRLVVGHRAGQTGTIAVTAFDGRTWTADQPIPAGPLGEAIRGTVPALASVNGFLHLVHTTPESSYVRWTYFDGCRWSAEVSIGTITSTTGLSIGPSLTQGGRGLVLETESDSTDIFGITSYFVETYQFTAPPPPLTPPDGCGVIAQ